MTKAQYIRAHLPGLRAYCEAMGVPVVCEVSDNKALVMPLGDAMAFVHVTAEQLQDPATLWPALQRLVRHCLRLKTGLPEDSDCLLFDY